LQLVMSSVCMLISNFYEKQIGFCDAVGLFCRFCSMCCWFFLIGKWTVISLRRLKIDFI
jgi:hypothetical protein